MFSKGALKTSYIAIAVIVIIVIAAIAIYFTTMPTPTPTTPKLTTPTSPIPTTPTPTLTIVKKTWRIGTLDPGTTGYKVTAFVVDVLSKEMPHIDFSVMPYHSAAAYTKAFALGELDWIYGTDYNIAQLYKRIGPFKGFEPKKLPVQVLITFDCEKFILTTPEKAKHIKSWRDLDGKNVFLLPAGYITHDTLKFIFSLLNIKVNHVEVDFKMVADALQAGTIDATAGYVMAKVAPPPWLQQAEMAIDLVPVNPSEDEIKAIEKAGFKIVEVNVTAAFSKIRGKLLSIPHFIGYQCGTDISEDDVYKVIKTIEANIKALAKLDSSFSVAAEDFVGLQVTAVKTFLAYHPVPIHPGLAKYLKEKGVWDPAWDRLVAK